MPRPVSGKARRSVPAGFALLLLCCCLPSCGYRVGGAYRGDVGTVHVPIFTVQGSFRRDVEFQLTEAVHKTIQNQTSFRLVGEAEADTQLTGRIIGLNKRVIGESGNDDGREHQYEIIVRVSWVDLRNRRSFLFKDKSIPIPADVLPLFAQAPAAPELGQSQATARQRAVETIARQIVQMMQMPW